jgi:spore germination cell wall hydrolase CwlJ-like protein
LAVATLLGEAGGEPYLGQLAVAKTIRNRMAMKYLSDGTVAGTVLRPLQFSMWNTSGPGGRDMGRIASCKASLEDPRVRQVQLAWFESAAKVPELGPVFDKVTMYHADYIATPEWARKSIRVRQIGRHIFYRDKR